MIQIQKHEISSCYLVMVLVFFDKIITSCVVGIEPNRNLCLWRQCDINNMFSIFWIHFINFERAVLPN